MQYGLSVLFRGKLLVIIIIIIIISIERMNPIVLDRNLQLSTGKRSFLLFKDEKFAFVCIFLFFFFFFLPLLLVYRFISINICVYFISYD